MTILIILIVIGILIMISHTKELPKKKTNMDKNLPRLDFVGSKTPVADESQTPIVYLFWFFFQVALFLGENRTVIRW